MNKVTDVICFIILVENTFVSMWTVMYWVDSTSVEDDDDLLIKQ